MGRRRRPWGRMRRTLVVWFGVTILVTGAMVGLTHRLLAPEARTWEYNMRRLEIFAANEFGRVWHDDVAREDLAERAAHDLDVGIELYDAHDRRLSAHGPDCRVHHRIGTQVRSDGAVVGSLSACWPHRPMTWWPLVGTIVVACSTLWWAAGILARKMTRPLDRLAEFAHRLADGDLDARVGKGRWRRGELGILADALDEMATTVTRQIAEGRELLAAVSHEIRTPLAHLRVLVEMLRDSGADPRAVADLEREIVDIDALVGKLLADARLQFSAESFTMLDATELVARAMTQCGVPHDKLDDDRPGTELRGDPTLLSRALANLLENARNHGGGVAKVRVRADDLQVRFSVDDDGPGFDDDDLAAAFEPFVRGKGGSRHGQAALGLGLALVKRIAVAHGGDAWAENRPGGGATVGFTVRRERPIAAPT